MLQISVWQRVAADNASRTASVELHPLGPSTGRFLYSAYEIRWVTVCRTPFGDYVGAIIDRPLR